MGPSYHLEIQSARWAPFQKNAKARQSQYHFDTLSAAGNVRFRGQTYVRF
jgi:hypothetical protein